MTKDTKQVRRTKNIRANKLALREQLQANEYLRQIQFVADKVQEQWNSLDSSEVAALKLLADVNFRRLNKVLPDLKSLEIDANVKVSTHEQLLDQLDQASAPIEGTSKRIN